MVSMITRSGSTISPRYQGFTNPPYTFVFQDDSGVPVNLNGVDPTRNFSLQLQNINNSTNVIIGNGTWTIIDATNGKAKYQWSAGDLSTIGTFRLYASVQLPGATSATPFDPIYIAVAAWPTGGSIVVSLQDINISEVGGVAVGSGNPVPVQGPVQGTPDGGITFKTLKTASDGTLATNNTLQPGTSLAGGLMTYHEMVARSLAGAVKYLTGNVTLGTGQSAAIAFVDQNGNAYSQVTNGKTLYIAHIDATCDLGATSALQSTLMTITDATNLKYQSIVTSNSPARQLDVPITLASQTTLTVKAGASNLATPAGKLWVSIICWEE